MMSSLHSNQSLKYAAKAAGIALLTLAFSLGSWSISAQTLPTRATMPDSVVLVLKRVNNERVIPTTGVVIKNESGQGLVVVPAGFVEGSEPIFVLDLGTDLFLDGLPAERFRISEDDGLAVLSVSGLQRRPMVFTFNAPETDHELRLAAFPPAEMMAKGSLPFWIPVDVAANTPGQPQELTEGTSVPNLTGPLIDLCGQWAGMVIANGQPGVSGTEPPQVLLIEDLLRASDNLRVDYTLEACMQFAPTGGTVALNTPDVRPGATASFSEDLSVDSIMRDARLGIGAMVFLISALISGLVFWLIVKRRATQQRKAKLQRTLSQDTVTFSATGLPTRHTRQTREEQPTFNPGTRPPGTNGWLRIEGKHADGRPLRAVTAISEGKFQAIIGRAGVALAADGPGISRKHAVIVGEGGRLTISDLGSRNGTFVNGVRCQKDEVFFIEPGDKLLLGAAEVVVDLKPAKGPVT